MISYHWRAYRYQSTLWQNHIEGVAQFLSAWKTKERLIWIGASGGYSVQQSWLEKFNSILVIEPDLLGRAILERRFSRVRERFVFSSASLRFDSPDFLEQYEPDTASILFSNVLGQIRIRDEFRLRRGLRSALHGRSWASYHDRFSSRDVYWNTPYGWSPKRLTTGELISERGVTGEVQEHLASELLMSSDVDSVLYWDWQIAPKQVHLIEGVLGKPKS